ncbi:hypothetical protein LTR08_004545 [Meristemomyces frigidus]|nr:hypothetical protein LTR08_004545 [Meristemomyces frigidus]
MGGFRNKRVYLLTAVAYMGSLLFGFDTGVMGSVLALDSFKKDFGLPIGKTGFASEKNAYISSNVVSLLTAGCFFGAIAAAFINEKIGRRFTLIAFVSVFLVGAAIQTAAHHEIGVIYGGRVIAGLGIDYGTVKVVATAIFLLVGIDQLGRKKALVFGGLWMSVMMIILGSVLATHPPDLTAGGVSSASLAMVVMIYFYVIGYSASWGPTPWVFVSEIFPTRLRAYGVGLAAATQWAFNLVITKVTPIAINSIGWKTFIMFGIFCFAMSAFVFFFVPETKRRTLEEMDVLFGAVDPTTRAADIEIAMAAEKKELEIERSEGSIGAESHTTKH